MIIKKISAKTYVDFYKKVYKNDPYFIDNKLGVFDILTNRKGAFYKNSINQLVGVYDGEKLKCVAFFVIHKNFTENLFVSLFEALENEGRAVDFLKKYAKIFAKNNSCDTLTFGIDGHINNATGFSLNTGKPTFGQNYCRHYYHDYFSDFNKIEFSSYSGTKEFIFEKTSKDMEKIDKYFQKINFEYGDFKYNFKNTMKRYTDMNNIIFADHPYYYERSYEEDCELFEDLRFLLKDENLIFATIDGNDVGFAFGYPDFNELVSVGKTAGIKTLLKYKMLKKVPKTEILMEFGVLEEYRKYGIASMLLRMGTEHCNERTERILSSWVMNSNKKSILLIKRYAKTHEKDLAIYEQKV